MSSSTTSAPALGREHHRLAAVAGLAHELHARQLGEHRRAGARAPAARRRQSGLSWPRVSLSGGSQNSSQSPGFDLQRGAVAVVVAHALADVLERHAVAARVRGASVRARIPDRRCATRCGRRPRPGSRPCRRSGSGWMPWMHGVLDQRLQQQRRDRQVVAAASSHSPVDLRAARRAAAARSRGSAAPARARAERLAARRRPRARRGTGPTGPRPRSRRRPGASVIEARDRVHAVEQEMRPDARLQRLHLGPRLRPHLALPLRLHVEVAEARRRSPARRSGAADHEALQRCRGLVSPSPSAAIELVHHGAAGRGDREHRERRPAATPACGASSRHSGRAAGTATSAAHSASHLHEHAAGEQLLASSGSACWSGRTARSGSRARPASSMRADYRQAAEIGQPAGGALAAGGVLAHARGH